MLELGGQRLAFSLELRAHLFRQPLERGAQRRPPALLRGSLGRRATATFGPPPLDSVRAAPRARRNDAYLRLGRPPGEEGREILDPQVTALRQRLEHTRES